ncbi:MAG: SIMPL domain-containing protein [Mucinivorans sp.]
MERTIKVTGKANIAVAPDTIQLLIDLSGIKESYDQSRELSISCSCHIQQAIQSLGLDKRSLKTRSYSIDAKYDTIQNRDKSWNKKFLGYSFNHQMKLEFPIDNELLGKVIHALNDSPIRPGISINYTIKSPASIQNELLAKAVADSATKAMVMAKAAGVTLAEVVSIDYSWGEIDILHRYNTDMTDANMCYESSSIDLTPEDIDLSDTVTIVWSLK